MLKCEMLQKESFYYTPTRTERFFANVGLKFSNSNNRWVTFAHVESISPFGEVTIFHEKMPTVPAIEIL